MPRPSNYAKAVRCPDCAKARRKTGSLTRASRDPNSPRRTRQRETQERERIEAIQATHFVGIDGEGINELLDPVNYPEDRNYPCHCDWPGGECICPERVNHRYVYMAAACSCGWEADLTRREGQAHLTLRDMLWWMWKIKNHAKGARFSYWFYSAKYDWTHIFRDLVYDEIDRKTLNTIYHPDPQNPFEPVLWNGWGISYVQGAVKISRTFENKEGKEITASRFYQDGFKCWGGGSFVSVLKAWEVGDPERIDQIEAMKAERSNFSVLTEEVKEYCREEVRLLAQLAQKIVTVAAEMGIRPKGGNWYSAGSLAKALLRVHGIAADEKTGWEGYRGPDRYAGAPEDIRTILMRTYAGGWFEIAETGIFPCLWSIDLASAYPAVIRDLPCLSHGEWTREYTPGGVNFGHVRWEPNHDGDSRFGPLFWRFPNQRIYHPEIGEGWYAEAEIEAAKGLGSFDIEVIEWVSFRPGCDHRPFSWVQEVYDLRVSLGKDGKGLVLKVTLNSVYGTFADTLSLDSPYASIIWASMITAGTRAELLKVLARYPDDVVGFATDGVLLKTPPTDIMNKVTKKVLGEFDFEGTIENVLLIQPGMYLAETGVDPKKMVRNRGHAYRDLKEIEARLREAWLRDGWEAQVEYERTRLIPGKLSLARKDPIAVYGQWVTQPVTISFRPSTRVIIDQAGPMKPSVASHRHLYHPQIAGTDLECSAPYNKLLALEVLKEWIDQKELAHAQP